MLGDKKPRRLHTLLESRVALEAALNISTLPLQRFLPTGDNHPVLVIPAFMSTDGLTRRFRRSIDKLGYQSHPWQLGVNQGIREHYLSQLEDKLREMVLRYQQPVSVVGWSLGGFYARALANLHPECVRQVITLGSPFGIPNLELKGVQSGVARLYSLFNRLDDPMLGRPELWQDTPPVPCTGIYTESDGIIHWHYCVDRSSDTCQNIRVRGSHVGLTHNPLVLYLVADRLRYRAKTWRPFHIQPWQKPFFQTICRKDIETAELPMLEGLAVG